MVRGLAGMQMNPIKTCCVAGLALLLAAPGVAIAAPAKRHGAHVRAVRKSAVHHRATAKAITRPAQLANVLDLNAPADLPPALKASTVERMEATLRLPHGSAPLKRYVRLYTVDRAGSVDDLPMTTVRDDLVLPQGRRIVVGVLVLPDRFRRAQLGAPGPRIVPRSQMLQFYQGGCAVVNVVYDPAARRTLAIWCNNADRVELSP